MMPYTRDALDMIRNGIRRGHPSDTIRTELGWPVSMFNNICQRNGLDARVALDDAGALKPTVKASDPDPEIDLPQIKTSRHEKLAQIRSHIPAAVLDKLKQLSRTTRMSENRLVCEMVHLRVMLDDLHKIKLVPPAGPRKGSVSIKRLFSIPISDCNALEQSATRRSGHVSVGMMVKAIVCAHFEGGS